MRTGITILLCAILLLLAASASTFADPGDTLWTRTYGGTNNEEAHSVEQTSDGGYIIAGYTGSYGAGGNDFYLVKTNSSRVTEWTQTYGGNGDDWAESVQQTTDGGYVVAGYTTSFGAGGRDFYVVKTDGAGTIQWARTYGGSGNDRAFCVQQTTDDGYVIVGETASFGAGAFDIYLLKIDSEGDITWARTYGTSTYEHAYSVEQTADGGYVIAGIRWYSIHYDWYILRTDDSGNLVWSRQYGTSADEYSESVHQTLDGGFIVSGFTRSFGAGGADMWLMKLGLDGDTAWTKTYGGALNENALDVQQTIDGGYILVGYSTTFGLGPASAYVVRTDGSGTVLWTHVYDGTGEDEVWSVDQTTDGGYIMAGYTNSFGAGGYDFYLLKIEGEQPPPCGEVSMVPDSYPINVCRGGFFGLTGYICNENPDPIQTDVWVGVRYLDTVYDVLLYFPNISLDPGQCRNAHLNQYVPISAPYATYDYVAYCGDRPMKCDSFQFQFTVIPCRVEGGATDWTLEGGWDAPFTIPNKYALTGSYPNPFNATTSITYELPEASQVNLEVYNLLGQKVTTLVNGKVEAGNHTITWDASHHSSGIYFYRLAAGDKVFTKRMTLLK